MSTESARGPIRREFRNDKAVYVWGFMVVWLAMLAAMTYVFVRDGGFPGTGAWGPPVLGLFWLFGIGGARWAATYARVHVTLSIDGVLVRERYPFSSIEKRYRLRDLAAPRIEESKDSDGDPYYACVIELPGGGRVAVAEGSHRPDVEAVLAQLRTSLARVG